MLSGLLLLKRWRLELASGLRYYRTLPKPGLSRDVIDHSWSATVQTLSFFGTSRKAQQSQPLAQQIRVDCWGEQLTLKLALLLKKRPPRITHTNTHA